MKNLFLILFATFLYSFNIQAQNNPVGTQDSIVFDKTVYDYGTINQGDDGNCEFKFMNKGGTPLILRNVRASCGCTVADWPKEPILPDNTGIIKVRYNTAIIGSFSKSITVISNAKNSTVVLMIKGNVIPQN